MPVPLLGRGLGLFRLVSGSGLAGGSAHPGARPGPQGQVRKLQRGLWTLDSRSEHPVMGSEKGTPWQMLLSKQEPEPKGVVMAYLWGVLAFCTRGKA